MFCARALLRARQAELLHADFEQRLRKSAEDDALQASVFFINRALFSQLELTSLLLAGAHTRGSPPRQA